MLDEISHGRALQLLHATRFPLGQSDEGVDADAAADVPVKDLADRPSPRIHAADNLIEDETAGESVIFATDVRTAISITSVWASLFQSACVCVRACVMSCE